MSALSILRQEIDRLTRPGQAGSTVVAHRSPGRRALGHGNAAPLNTYVPATQCDKQYGRYGRGKYLTARYGPGA